MFVYMNPDRVHSIFYSKSMFIVAEIKIICKMRSFIHVFKCISAQIVGKIRLSVHESETGFNLE